VKHIVKKRLGVQGGELNQAREYRFAVQPHDEDEASHCDFLLGPENHSLFKLLMDVLEQRRDSDECVELKHKVIDILNDVIKLQKYVLPLFSKRGIIVFLLKILFDPEVRIEKHPPKKHRELSLNFETL